MNRKPSPYCPNEVISNNARLFVPVIRACVLAISLFAVQTFGASATNRQEDVQIALNESGLVELPNFGGGRVRAATSTSETDAPVLTTEASKRDVHSPSPGTRAAATNPSPSLLFDREGPFLSLTPRGPSGVSGWKWRTSPRSSGGAKLPFGLWSQTSPKYRPVVEDGEVERPKPRAPMRIELSTQ